VPKAPGSAILISLDDGVPDRGFAPQVHATEPAGHEASDALAAAQADSGETTNRLTRHSPALIVIAVTQPPD
jgi:hypothetical protein